MKKTKMQDGRGFIETSTILFSGIHYGRTDGGWLLLVKLPKNKGLNLGTGFSGYYSVRDWYMAKYDYADHFMCMGHVRAWLEEQEPAY
jgi:hypothetical protein